MFWLRLTPFTRFAIVKETVLILEGDERIPFIAWR